MIGIIMTAESVRDILDGRKTQTRRAIDLKSGGLEYWGAKDGIHEFAGDGFYCEKVKPRCKPGDILYVKETWCEYFKSSEPPYLPYLYTLLIGIERNNMYRAEDRATINRLKSENERLQMKLAEANGLPDVGIQQLMQTMRERDQAVDMLERMTKDLIQLCEWLRASPAIGERTDDATAEFMAAGGIEA